MIYDAITNDNSLTSIYVGDRGYIWAHLIGNTPSANSKPVTWGVLYILFNGNLEPTTESIDWIAYVIWCVILGSHENRQGTFQRKSLLIWYIVWTRGYRRPMFSVESEIATNMFACQDNESHLVRHNCLLNSWPYEIYTTCHTIKVSHSQTSFRHSTQIILIYYSLRQHHETP